MAKKIWNEEAIEEYVELENYKYIEMISLNGMKSKIKIWCRNSSHTPYVVRFDAFKGSKSKNGTRCNQCRIDNDSIWDEESIIKYVESNGYKFISFSKFNKYASIIKIWCGNPNHKPYETYFGNFRSNQRCYKCTIVKWDEITIPKYINENGYTFIKFLKYDNRNSLIEIECPNNHITSIRFRKFREGCRCSMCNESKGENMVANVLNNNSINYIREFKFDDCKCKNTLPFDFFLNDLNILIEYDGVQHFKILPHWGGIDKLIEQKIHDTIKDLYCKKNNIKLIRIPYWEFKNIQFILNKELVLN